MIARVTIIFHSSVKVRSDRCRCWHRDVYDIEIYLLKLSHTRANNMQPVCSNSETCIQRVSECKAKLDAFEEANKVILKVSVMRIEDSKNEIIMINI